MENRYGGDRQMVFVISLQCLGHYLSKCHDRFPHELAVAEAYERTKDHLEQNGEVLAHDHHRTIGNASHAVASHLVLSSPYRRCSFRRIDALSWGYVLVDNDLSPTEEGYSHLIDIAAGTIRDAENEASRLLAIASLSYERSVRSYDLPIDPKEFSCVHELETRLREMMRRER